MAQVAQDAAATSRESAAEQVSVLTGLTAATRHIALLSAMLATCGSLYFSEVLRWIPCELCWYQRILMYPLAVVLLVGILRDDRGLAWYGLPFSLSGIALSLYHYLQVIQLIPPAACVGLVPCGIDYLTPILTGPLSFIKIPFLALVAFGLISVMLGNYALAGAPVPSAQGRRGSRVAAVVIVVVTILVFVGLGLLVGL
ncbi:disulfide bond formation protein B [Candidatus Chloroploca asiatica]|uniref:Disulfide bond formation protein DsbB n=1 Tax=Candidatus Chloroploca asiatica TaxID=1506545 RepID=A0A2H3KR60_9CHLR|nr:disulfide bond formation protein B [Candidatus Chloroploca asiatica]PDW00888.1 disulfide bond formation protein DsbB [Candidatus Chloroploca asiatica]